MLDPFVGEISVTAFNFAPQGWALCNGQLLPINQNAALFSLLGTYYGGNGTTNFALPNLQGRVPLGAGNGLSPYVVGQNGGEETVILQSSQIPAHNHGVPAAGAQTSDRAVGLSPAAGGVYGIPSGGASMASTLPAGNNQPHNNMQPYLTLNFIIALQGVFPSRS